MPDSSTPPGAHTAAGCPVLHLNRHLQFLALVVVMMWQRTHMLQLMIRNHINHQTTPHLVHVQLCAGGCSMSSLLSIFQRQLRLQEGVAAAAKHGMSSKSRGSSSSTKCGLSSLLSILPRKLRLHRGQAAAKHAVSTITSSSRVCHVHCALFQLCCTATFSAQLKSKPCHPATHFRKKEKKPCTTTLALCLHNE